MQVKAETWNPGEYHKRVVGCQYVSNFKTYCKLHRSKECVERQHVANCNSQLYDAISVKPKQPSREFRIIQNMHDGTGSTVFRWASKIFEKFACN